MYFQRLLKTTLRSLSFASNVRSLCFPVLEYSNTILTCNGIYVDSDKTSAIANTSSPTNVKQIQSDSVSRVHGINVF